MPDTFPNRAALAAHQFTQLRTLLAALVPANPFYTRKLAAAGLKPGDITSLADFSARYPLTTKSEIVADQTANPPYGTNLTFPLARYTRCHQTSGTSGTPLRWLDTNESWEWMLGNWERVHRAGGVTHDDRIFFAFSFGPFLGFWTAFESAVRIGALVLPGGGMTSAARLRNILEQQATVLCCTPTYAIHLAEVAAQEKMDLRKSPVRLLSVAGEPGGCIPAVRERLQALWPGARVHDHHGMTEIGPVSYEDPARPCALRVIESSYIAEIIHPQTLQPVAPGEPGELVLTNLGRTGSPLLRYRTGDLVRARPATLGARDAELFLALEGGILGRVDDMVVVRGMNIYPSAVDEIIHDLGGVAEYRVHVATANAMTELRVEIEPTPGCADAPALAAKLERRFHTALSLRVPVSATPPGALPRFEAKAKRWVFERGK
ncbi:MAG: AMP-binding protein [Verrucomicrobia bacterium]|nr:AMP-binding protein [Verrucomicrobiota bacterium]